MQFQGRVLLCQQLDPLYREEAPSLPLVRVLLVIEKTSALVDLLTHYDKIMQCTYYRSVTRLFALVDLAKLYVFEFC